MNVTNSAAKKEVDKYRDHARTLIDHYFGGAPKRLHFLTSGLSNFVFSVRHASGNFIVRISPDAGRLDSFIKEQWAQAEAAKYGVPTGRILETGSSLIPLPYMISEETQGIEATRHPDRFKIIRELGQYAAIINKIATKGYGKSFDWSANKLSRRATFAEFFEHEFCADARIKVLESNRIADRQLIRSLKKIVREMSALTSKPRLNHGDLRLKNVFVNAEGKIVAILDWENAVSNVAPQWELSIALHDLNIDEKQHFLAGYDISGRRFREIAPQIKAFNLLNYTGEIERAVSERDKYALENIKQRFSGVLDLYAMA